MTVYLAPPWTPPPNFPDADTLRRLIQADARHYPAQEDPMTDYTYTDTTDDLGDSIRIEADTLDDAPVAYATTDETGVYIQAEDVTEVALELLKAAKLDDYDSEASNFYARRAIHYLRQDVDRRARQKKEAEEKAAREAEEKALQEAKDRIDEAAKSARLDPLAIRLCNAHREKCGRTGDVTSFADFDKASRDYWRHLAEVAKASRYRLVRLSSAWTDRPAIGILDAEKPGQVAAFSETGEAHARQTVERLNDGEEVLIFWSPLSGRYTVTGDL